MNKLPQTVIDAIEAEAKKAESEIDWLSVPKESRATVREMSEQDTLQKMLRGAEIALQTLQGEPVGYVHVDEYQHGFLSSRHSKQQFEMYPSLRKDYLPVYFAPIPSLPAAPVEDEEALWQQIRKNLSAICLSACSYCRAKHMEWLRENFTLNRKK